MQSQDTLLTLLAVACLGVLGLIIVASPVNDSPSELLLEPKKANAADITDQRLYGKWVGKDESSGFILNLTPHVLFLFSEDEQDVLEIAVDHHEPWGDQGSMSGVVKANRINKRRTDQSERRVRFTYYLEGDSLEIAWIDPMGRCMPSLEYQFNAERLNPTKG